jgi:hypothetical protein
MFRPKRTRVDRQTRAASIDGEGQIKPICLARLGRPVLVVLIVSLLAVVGILSLIFYGNFG